MSPKVLFFSKILATGRPSHSFTSNSPVTLPFKERPGQGCVVNHLEQLLFHLLHWVSQMSNRVTPPYSLNWVNLKGSFVPQPFGSKTNPFLLPKDQKSTGQLLPFPLYSDTFTFISKFTPQRSKVPSMRACWEKKVGRLWSVLNAKEFGLDPVTPQRALQGSEVIKLDFRNS